MHVFYINFQENGVLHIVNEDFAIEDLKDSGIEGDFSFLVGYASC